MPLLLPSPEVLVNALSRRQALGQEMSNSRCFKISDFKKGLSFGEIGKLNPRLKQEELVGFLPPSLAVHGVVCFPRILWGFYLRECLLLKGYIDQ